MENSTMPNLQAGVPAEGGKKVCLIVAVAVVVVLLGAGYWWWQRGEAGVGDENMPATEQTTGDVVAPVDDTTAAIQSDLDALNVGTLDQDFNQIDSDLNQL